jgi:hypothetical protein
MRNTITLVGSWLAVQFIFGNCQTITSVFISTLDESSLGSDSTPCFSALAAYDSTSCFYGVSCWPTSWTSINGPVSVLPSSALCPSSLNACETISMSSASALGYLFAYEVHCGRSFTSRTTASLMSNINSSGSANTISSYPPLPSFTGGDLLRNYCATPEFTLLYGPQSTVVYYAAFVGCVNDKPDCCPFAVSTSTSTTTEIVIATTTGITAITSSFLTFISPSTSIPSSQTSTRGIVSPSSVIVSTVITVVVTSTQSSTLIPQQFPVAVSEAQSTLSSCPEDYHMVSSSCCPL